jgi:hypothetical protein
VTEQGLEGEKAPRSFYPDLLEAKLKEAQAMHELNPEYRSVLTLQESAQISDHAFRHLRAGTRGIRMK